MRTKDRTGIIGEELAAEHLRARGHRVLARRWRCRSGELDLLTRAEDTLVAVEVKTRRGTGYGHPLEAVDAVKLNRLHRLLLEYAAEHRLLSVPRRVDVVGIILGAGDLPAQIDHLQDVRP